MGVRTANLQPLLGETDLMFLSLEEEDVPRLLGYSSFWSLPQTARTTNPERPRKKWPSSASLVLLLQFSLWCPEERAFLRAVYILDMFAMFRLMAKKNCILNIYRPSWISYILPINSQLQSLFPLKNGHYDNHWKWSLWKRGGRWKEIKW